MRVSEANYLAITARIQKSISSKSGTVKQQGEEKDRKSPIRNIYGEALATLQKHPHLRTGVNANGVRVGQAKHEHWEQVEVFNWLFIAHQEFIDDFYAVANGGIRVGYSGFELKKEGVQQGQPDINCDLPRGKYHGLRIEMKWGNNGPSEMQKAIMNRRKVNGYFCALCYSSLEAIAVITEYLNLKEGEVMMWNLNEHLWANAN